MVQPAPDVKFTVDIPAEMLEAMTGNGTIAPRISRDQALQVPAVLRARNLIAGSLGTLPIRVHGPDRRVATGTWLVPQPDPEIASSVVMAQTIEDMLFEGVSWWRVTAFGPPVGGRQGFPIQARHVPHQSVHVAPMKTLRPSEALVSPDQPFPVDGQVFIDGIPVPDREIIRFDSPNPPLLTHAARPIRTCLALDTAASLYAKDPLPLGYFAPRDLNADPASDAEIQEVLDDWEEARAKRAWGYVNAAIEAKTLSWNPEQLQLADQRQHAVLEIARATGVDPEYLGVSTTTRTYVNSEQRRQDLIDFTLGPYVSAIQDRLSMRDVLPRDFVARIDFAGFLRGDTKTRMDTYEVGLRVGAYADVDEVRELEDRPALTPAQRKARAATQQPTIIPPAPPSRAAAEVTEVITATVTELAQFVGGAVLQIRNEDNERRERDEARVAAQFNREREQREDAEREQRESLMSELMRERERTKMLEAQVIALTKMVEKLTGLIETKTGAERVNFAAEPLHLTFGTDEVLETFRVNAEKRTVSGLLVPWGKVARAGFNKWKFGEGSLHWSSEGRVKLNLNHNFDQIIGLGRKLQSTSRGLEGTFYVARGEEGNKALSLAEDGVLDGFSVEVEFVEEAGDGWQPDPSDESIRLVNRGTLRGTALTGMPAFDDARLTSVAATREGGGTMPTPDKNQSGAGGTPDADGFASFMSTLAEKIAESQKSATEGLTELIGEQISAGIKAALENIHDPQADGPQPVRAARWTVTREAPVYTLNGAGPSLVRDAWHAQMSRDDDAMERIRKFRKQTEDVAAVAHSQLHMGVQGALQFATSTTSTNPQIIPPGYRPDLFVPQLAQGRPFVNAMSRGVIANATPFVVPVFGSATGATADHVEGNNPVDGTLAFTTKTVTPGAISGLLKLTREIVDSSNPAIDQIALSAMGESYARQTEAKVYTLLNGASGQAGVMSPVPPAGGGFALQANGAQVGAVGTTLTGATLLARVRNNLSRYPFNRFAAPNQALMSQRATSAFADAVDSTGRPLLPSVGAANTAGLGNALTQGWFVDGLAHVPAWAITGVTDGDGDVFILASADAWVWESPILTFRYEERSGPAVIDLALFGYFATHLLRPVGLSAIRFSDGIA